MASSARLPPSRPRPRPTNTPDQRIPPNLPRRARAARGGDPEVGRTGVEVDEELLRRGADGDLARPLGVRVLVGEGLALALGEMLREHRERLDLSALVEHVRTDVLLEVDQVLTVLAVEGGTSTASVNEQVRHHVYVLRVVC